MDAKCYRLDPNGLSLFVRVTPRAGRDRIDGIQIRDDGNAVLRVRLKAAPENGQANAGLLGFMAGVFGVPKSDIVLKSGETARQKTLFVSGDPTTLAAKIDALQ